MNYDDFMNMKEAAAYVHLNYDRFKVMHYSGQIPYITFGKRRYFLKESLDEWMKSIKNQKTNKI